MLLSKFLSALLGFGAFQLVAALPPITAVGAKFFTSAGDQFFVKGIAYQRSPDDPLVDTSQCELDATLMKDLGANAIRVYHVDDDGDHQGCMSAFDEAGIYVFLDLDTFTTWISPDFPTWNTTQFERYAAVFDEFQQFENLGGFFVGNEVLTKPENVEAAPYVKAAARDMKAYRDSEGYRKIPIGYAAADISLLRPMLQNYLVCGGNASEAIDFFSLNAYEWCGPVDYQTSGYQLLQEQANDFPIPIFFSETGCNTQGPREFRDMAAIFGDQMSGTWSGAIVYEWIEEANHYGLINYGGSQSANMDDGFVRAGTPTPINPDFENLKSQWATAQPKGVKLSAYSASASALETPECPTITAGWSIDGNPSLPTLEVVMFTAAIVGTAAHDSSSSGTSSTSSSPTSMSTTSTGPGALNTAVQSDVNEGEKLAGAILAIAVVMFSFVFWT